MVASTNTKWERRKDATSKKHESVLLRMERVHEGEMQGLKRKHEAEIAMLEKKLQRSSAPAASLEMKHGRAVAKGEAAYEKLAQ